MIELPSLQIDNNLKLTYRMSSIRSVDSSTSFYGDGNLYALKSGGSSNLSAQIFNSDQTHLFGQPKSNSDMYNRQYFTNPSQFLRSHVSVHQDSAFNVSGTVCRPQLISSYQLTGNAQPPSLTGNHYASCFTPQKQDSSPFSNSSEQTSQSFSDSQSPFNELDCHGDEVRLKLQELERALLNDNDDELGDVDLEMELDDDWADPIKDILSQSSPKESSSDSNLSSNDSIRDTRTPKRLLLDCASAISEGNMHEASNMIAELRQMVSVQGDPPQRLAAYMVEGLAARIAYSGQGLYKALRCKEPPTLDRLSAMQILFEVCPCFKFGFMAANGAITEAVKDEERVHIIDFDINQGSQYFNLIQDFASRQKKPPHLRITGVDDPESVQRSVGGLKIIGQRLEKLAEDLGVPFEFHPVAATTGDITPAMLECRPGEALVVNFAFQLHHMPDESVSTVNQRDCLLRMVKRLSPKLVTMVEQDVNTNTAPFFPRFVEVYNYYSAVFESLDATLPRESPDRMNVERQCLARDIINIVACEGADRIERYEAAGKWRARMTMAGFVSCPLSPSVNGTIRSLLKQYCDQYKLKEDTGALHFGWEDKILVVASAWK